MESTMQTSPPVGGWNAYCAWARTPDARHAATSHDDKSSLLLSFVFKPLERNDADKNG